jgi:hypothetical protein
VATNRTADNQDFKGSAGPYGVGDMLFAFEISRDCHGNSYCMDLTEGQLPVGMGWAVIYRTYLEPGTATAPKLSEIYAPTLMHFSC